MTKEIVTRIQIDASPSDIWGVLTNFASYPNWNPFITRIEGQPVMGQALRITLTKPSGKSLPAFTATVTAHEHNRLLRWHVLAVQRIA